MGPGDTCLELQGSFSWGFTSNQPKKDDKEKNEKAGKSAVEQENAEDSNQGKKLSKFITLKDINLQIKKGEFVCIIGDVGSGKSSLLQSVIGDLIYLPQNVIDEFGGPDHEGT